MSMEMLAGYKEKNPAAKRSDPGLNIGIDILIKALQKSIDYIVH